MLPAGPTRLSDPAVCFCSCPARPLLLLQGPLLVKRLDMEFANLKWVQGAAFRPGGGEEGCMPAQREQRAQACKEWREHT
jgi:hypothetical protein